MGQNINARATWGFRLAPASAKEVVYRPLGSVRALDWQAMCSPQQMGRWEALARCAVQPNPFYEHWFLLPSLKALDARCSASCCALK